MATGIRIGCRKLTTFAMIQITATTMKMRKQIAKALNADQIALRCHSFGYREWEGEFMALLRRDQSCSLSFCGCQSSPPGPYLMDRVRALFAKLRSLAAFGSASNRCCRDGRRPRHLLAADFAQLALSFPRLVQIFPVDIGPKPCCRDKRHFPDRAEVRV